MRKLLLLILSAIVKSIEDYDKFRSETLFIDPLTAIGIGSVAVKGVSALGKMIGAGKLAKKRGERPQAEISEAIKRYYRRKQQAASQFKYAGQSEFEEGLGATESGTIAQAKRTGASALDVMGTIASAGATKTGALRESEMTRISDYARRQEAATDAELKLAEEEKRVEADKLKQYESSVAQEQTLRAGATKEVSSAIGDIAALGMSGKFGGKDTTAGTGEDAKTPGGIAPELQKWIAGLSPEMKKALFPQLAAVN